MIDLGGNIRKARLAKGLTQKELAELIGVKHNSISDWENNKCSPDIDTIEALMGVLEVDANFLFGICSRQEKGEAAERTASNIINDDRACQIINYVEGMSKDDFDALLRVAEKFGKK